MKTAFKRLVNLVPRRGLIVAFDGSANVTECVQPALSAASSATASAPNADWQIRNLRHEDGLTRWEVWRDGAALVRSSRCISPANTTRSTPPPPPRLPPARASARKRSETALATFKSVKRRLEVRAEISGITIIEDFAHHPTAIRETLRALRSVYPAVAPVGSA